MAVLWIVSMLIIKKVKLYKFWWKENLNISISQKEIKYIYEILQFPSTNKMKRKKELMRDKMRTKNAE